MANQMTPEKRLKSIRNWMAMADYDLETAKHMLKTGRYIYVVFMCHLSLEKMIKAHVEMAEGKFPPKIHDLETLAQRAELTIPSPLNKIILELNKASIPTRYPEDLQRSLADYSKKYCSRVLKETRETLQWLKTHPRLSNL
ncbi:MAG: HEPN domain-containing protein [bacterium]